MENILFYKVMPSLDQLREDFSKLIQQNKQFQGMIKVGKTSRKRMSTRYDNTHKYEKLSEKNIFCLCSSQEIALEVERIAQEFTKEMGKHIWQSDIGEGTLGGDDDDYVVYVTTLKTNLFQCPLESCRKVMTKDGIESHKLSHEFIVSTIARNDMLKKMSISPMSANVNPIPWKFEDGCSKVCPDCGKEFGRRAIMLAHRKSCPEYFNRIEKIKCSKCERYVARNTMWRHIAYHHNHKDRRICDICGKEMAKSSLKYHMDLHVDGTKRVPCKICKKLIGYSMKEHVKHVHKGEKKKFKKCTVCGRMVKDIHGHMSIHLDKKKCPQCSLSFPAKRLQRHINDKHSEDGKEVVSCNQCDKKGTKAYMREHKRTHTRVRCPTCNKELSTSGLRLHKCPLTLSKSKPSTNPQQTK